MNWLLYTLARPSCAPLLGLDRPLGRFAQVFDQLQRAYRRERYPHLAIGAGQREGDRLATAFPGHDPDARGMGFEPGTCYNLPHDRLHPAALPVRGGHRFQ